MAAVTRLGARNKVEVFDRLPPYEMHQMPEAEKLNAKATDVMNAAPFDKFGQRECRSFIKEYGQTLIARSVDSRTNALEDLLVEQGLCAGAKERIPCVLASTLTETDQTPYPVVRVIFGNNRNEWQLVGELECVTILLRKHDHRWYVEMRHRYASDKTIYSSTRLIFSPERFLRFSEKFERYFNIEKVALESLNVFFRNKHLPDLVMQYTGYPAEVEKQNAEREREKLMEQAKNYEHQRIYTLPPPQQEEPAAAPAQPPGILKRIANCFSCCC